MRAVAWTVVIAAGLSVMACESIEDATSTSREIRERYGVEATSVHVARGVGPTVVTVEAVDPEAIEGEGVEERMRGMASIAAEAFALADTDSVVVALSAGEDGEAEGATATVTVRYAIGELDPASR